MSLYAWLLVTSCCCWSTLDYGEILTLSAFFPRCWALNENMNYWWIIRFPILFASLVRMIYANTGLRVLLHPLYVSSSNIWTVYIIYGICFFWSTDQLSDFHEDPEGSSLQITSQQPERIPWLQTSASCAGIFSMLNLICSALSVFFPSQGHDSGCHRKSVMNFWQEEEWKHSQKNYRKKKNKERKNPIMDDVTDCLLFDLFC